MGTRRARALGILAQPAEALRLLIEHLQDRADEPNESTEQAAPYASSQDEPGCEPDTSYDDEPGCEAASDQSADDHQSLSMAVPPAFDATAADGPSTSLSRDTSFTAHPAGMSIWSPTKAPSPSAIPISALR